MSEELMIWIAQAVAHSLWLGLVIGALAWVAMRCVRRSPARQHGVLCVALLLMALCLPVTLAIFAPGMAHHRERNALPPVVVAPVSGEPIAAESATLSDGEAPAPVRSTAEEVRAPAESEPVSAAVLTWKKTAPWVVGAYGFGLLAMLARLLFACGGSRRLRRHSSEVTETSWRESFRCVLRRLEIKTEPVLAWSSEVAAPVLVGVLKPLILLPVALANRLTMEQAEAVLAHELAHLRRHDQWMLVVQRLVETVLFFHPVIWWMSRQLSRTREQACDDVVLASGSRPADYAEALVLCSELRLAGAGLREGIAMQLAATGPGHGTGSRESSLRQRVLRVLGKEDPIRPGKAGWILAGAMTVILLIAGVGLLPPATAQNPADPPGGAEDAAAEPLLPETDAEDPPAAAALNELAPPKAEPAVAILVEAVLAEVVDWHPLNAETITKEAFAKVGEIVSEPRLIVASGRTGKLETNRPAEIADPSKPRLITYATEVTPVWRRTFVQFTVKVTRAEEGGQGTKMLLSRELEGVAAIGSWKEIEVGPLIGGAKLVGAVRFLRAKPGQVINPPGVFQLLANGKVNWQGADYTVEELKNVLPQVGGTAVVRAGGDTRYAAVVKFLEVLKPVFRRGVSFAIDDQEADHVAARKPARLVEIEVQIAECEAQLATLQAELKTLKGDLGERHPKIRRTRNRIEAAEGYIRDLEAARARLKAAPQLPAEEPAPLPRPESPPAAPAPLPSPAAPNPAEGAPEETPLLLPGAEGKDGREKALFAIAMNSRLQRAEGGAGVKWYNAPPLNGRLQPGNVVGVEPAGLPQAVGDPPNNTVVFLERGLPGEKADPRAFAARHQQKGVLLFLDGQLGPMSARPEDLLQRESTIMDPAAFESELAWERAARTELPKLERLLAAERTRLQSRKDLEPTEQRSPVHAEEAAARVKLLERQVSALRALLSGREKRNEKKTRP